MPLLISQTFITSRLCQMIVPLSFGRFYSSDSRPSALLDPFHNFVKVKNTKELLLATNPLLFITTPILCETPQVVDAKEILEELIKGGYTFETASIFLKSYNSEWLLTFDVYNTTYNNLLKTGQIIAASVVETVAETVKLPNPDEMVFFLVILGTLTFLTGVLIYKVYKKYYLEPLENKELLSSNNSLNTNYSPVENVNQVEPLDNVSSSIYKQEYNLILLSIILNIILMIIILARYYDRDYFIYLWKKYW